MDQTPTIGRIPLSQGRRRMGKNRMCQLVAKRATSDDMSAFARELKVGPNSSEDSDSDNSSLQVLQCNDVVVLHQIHIQ